MEDNKPEEAVDEGSNEADAAAIAEDEDDDCISLESEEDSAYNEDEDEEEKNEFYSSRLDEIDEVLFLAERLTAI